MSKIASQVALSLSFSFLWICACDSNSASSASEATGFVSSEPFRRCWNFQPVSASVGMINFQAIIYPREGVLSYSAACPALTLQLNFNDSPMPEGFDGFERANSRHPEPIGIRGTAVVEIERVDHPGLMIVNVRRLVRGEVLSSSETARLILQMNR